MYTNLQITCTLCSFILSVSVYSQSSLNDERKKELLDMIKPSHLIIDPHLKNNKEQLSAGEETKIVNKDNIKEKVSYYRSGGIQFEDKRTIRGLDISMGYIDLFKLENGNVYKLHIINGKSRIIKKTMTDFIHDNLSQKNRLQGVKIEATTGGLNLSGFKEKKPMSTKSKNILLHVLGGECE